MAPKHTRIRVVSFHPGAESRGSLGSFPIVLSCYVTLYSSVTCLVPYSNYPLCSSTSVSAPASIPASVSLSTTLNPSRSRSRPPCSHHLRVTRALGRHSAAIHSSSIRRFAIYWAVLFRRRRTYVSTSSNPTTAITDSKGGYSHRPIMPRFVLIPTKRWDTLWCNPLRFYLIPGVITQVSNPNNRVV